jgi:Fe-S oxidoreductase
LCNNCKTCTTVCPSFAITEKDNIFSTNNYCTLCLRCQPKCNQKAIVSTINHKNTSKMLPFVSTLFSGCLSLFYVPLGIMELIYLIRGILK